MSSANDIKRRAAPDGMVRIVIIDRTVGSRSFKDYSREDYKSALAQTKKKYGNTHAIHAYDGSGTRLYPR